MYVQKYEYNHEKLGMFSFIKPFDFAASLHCRYKSGADNVVAKFTIMTPSSKVNKK